MLYHSIGHRIARFKTVRTRPEIAHMLFKVRHIAKLPAFHVLADFCKTAFSIERQELVSKFCLRRIITPVAIALDVRSHKVRKLEHVFHRAKALHHHGNRKERGTIIFIAKYRQVFSRLACRRCLSTTVPSAKAKATRTRTAKANAKRRKHIAQRTPALTSDRLVVARILHKLKDSRSRHMRKHVHVKRIALGQVHDSIKLYK